MAHNFSVLFGTFSEAATTDLRADFPEDKDSYRDDYEYPSDSDLEDEVPEVHDIDDGETLTTEEMYSENSLDFFSNHEGPSLDHFDLDIFPRRQLGDGDLRVSDILLPSKVSNGR